ncbi:uncharacterized protein LOC120772052 [Bactrocera tryoni]|uniref:uncharacterized protein LOC120772052 n=1 Tax=Bactrocera tryoni TaxID=59916 RepID=UPI001A96BA86|nr:uncharacterized protein LOC120772052 [Bactrocera tryoni]
MAESQIQEDVDIDEYSDVEDDENVLEEFSDGESSEEYIASEDKKSIAEGNISNIPVNFSKDKVIEWSTEPTATNNIRTRRKICIIRRQPGVTVYAVHRISNIKESFDLCFPQQIKKIIIEFTNIEGAKKIAEKYKPIDEMELDGFFGHSDRMRNYIDVQLQAYIGRMEKVSAVFGMKFMVGQYFAL